MTFIEAFGQYSGKSRIFSYSIRQSDMCGMSGIRLTKLCSKLVMRLLVACRFTNVML